MDNHKKKIIKIINYPALYLSIGGFSVRLVFEWVEFEHRRVSLMNLISKRYSGFLATDQNQKFDYTIRFIFSETLKSLQSTDKRTLFIDLYTIENLTTLSTFYHISLYQFDLILTHVLQILLSRNRGFFIHTSAVLANNRVSLFLGKSGDGKSTAAQLLKGKYAVIADDGIILRNQNKNWFVYQTPFLEKNETVQKSAKKYILGNLFFLHKDSSFAVTEVTDKSSVFDGLLGQLYSQIEDVEQQYKNLIQLVNKNDIFYMLYFKKESKGLEKILKPYL